MGSTIKDLLKWLDDPEPVLASRHIQSACVQHQQNNSNQLTGLQCTGDSQQTGFFSYLYNT